MCVVVSGIYSVKWERCRWLINWKGFERKRSWPNRNITPAFTLEGLKKNPRLISFGVASVSELHGVTTKKIIFPYFRLWELRILYILCLLSKILYKNSRLQALLTFLMAFLPISWSHNFSLLSFKVYISLHRGTLQECKLLWCPGREESACFHVVHGKGYPTQLDFAGCPQEHSA
jgi:hypothetical protein